MAGEEPIAVPPAQRIEEVAARRVAFGYGNRDDVYEYVEDQLTYEEVAFEPPQLRAVIDRLWHDRLEEQRGWPQVTDNDRLTRAFTGLRDARIVAREHFTCCQSCGIAEIEPEEGELDGEPVGYAFFHQQDTERGVDNGVLHLTYGSMDPDDGPLGTAEVGELVVAALAAEGLRVDWSGSEETRIAVHLNWQKRLDPDG